ncbi:MAG: metal-dependent hydrolase [Solirubrobacterales bacterium]
MTAVLVGAVLTLDLLWSLFEGSTGTLVYGFLDEPAHLATCAIALLVMVALTGSRLSSRFVLAALIASVAIDVDHIPAYLGWQGLTGALPRPYPHSLLVVAILFGLGWASKNRDTRQISLGLAFGVSAHLLRDLATGPGVPLAWPLSNDVFTMPYALFAGGLVAAALVVIARSVSDRRIVLVGLILAAVAVSVALQPRSADAAQTISLGTYIHGSQENPSLIDEYGMEVGQKPVIVSSYEDWTTPLIDQNWLEAVWSRGAVPMIAWEPWSWSNPDERFPLRAIVKGRYDGYMRSSAQAAAAWGEPIFVRFAHEMNGNWYPWGRGREGNTPAVYRAGWRHVVAIFRADGATNVKWVWTPYTANGGRHPSAATTPATGGSTGQASTASTAVRYSTGTHSPRFSTTPAASWCG